MANLGSVPGVRQARVEGSTVVVRVKPGANLMTVYRGVTAQAKRALGHAPAKVAIMSHSDSVLNALANNMQFVVAQGVATGQYVTMHSTIERMAHKVGATASLQLGANHLYLTYHHDGRVLYDVIPVAIGGTSRD